MDKQFLLIPGYVESRSDGDRHYIAAEELANLYGVSLKDCVVISSDEFRKFEPNPPPGYSWEYLKSLIALPVLYHGDYQIPVPISYNIQDQIRSSQTI